MSQSVVEVLREEILSGQLVAGTHLEEVPIATRLDVSRTPVRQALAQLAQEGLLDYAPKRGYVVRVFGLEDVAAAYDVRSSLEGLACRLVAERRVDDDTVSRLRDYVLTGDRILSKGRLDEGDFHAYRAMNVGFHQTILSLAGNRLLTHFVHQTYHLPLTSDRVMFWTDFKVIERSHDDHRRILDALSEGAAWRAEALMREHIHASGRFVMGQYRAGHVPVTSLDAANGPGIAAVHYL